MVTFIELQKQHASSDIFNGSGLKVGLSTQNHNGGELFYSKYFASLILLKDYKNAFSIINMEFLIASINGIFNWL